ncbi:sugar transporter erd6-like 5 [Quercus suber]|uniref:Sugar transporter erd6-like 5 n=1 Tax=Quercus suber TaxID=58331 RepID=A0AAW0JVD0_QUESU
MVLQQVGGVNSIAFYATIFILTIDKEFGSRIEEYFVYNRVFGSVGTVAMVAVQVLDSFHIPMTALGVIFMDKSGQQLLLLVRKLRNLSFVMELNKNNFEPIHSYPLLLPIYVRGAIAFNIYFYDLEKHTKDKMEIKSLNVNKNASRWLD